MRLVAGPGACGAVARRRLTGAGRAGGANLIPARRAGPRIAEVVDRPIVTAPRIDLRTAEALARSLVPARRGNPPPSEAVAVPSAAADRAALPTDAVAGTVASDRGGSGRQPRVPAATIDTTGQCRTLGPVVDAAFRTGTGLGPVDTVTR